jgi:hypothetical protein
VHSMGMHDVGVHDVGICSVGVYCVGVHVIDVGRRGVVNKTLLFFRGKNSPLKKKNPSFFPVICR